MSRPRAILRSVILWSGLACMLGGTGAAAQTPPARIGNVYDGTAHQPTPGVVHQNEHAAGVAPPPAQQKREADTVRQIDRQLLGPKDNLNNPQAPRQ